MSSNSRSSISRRFVGPNALDRLADHLVAAGSRRVLLVTGRRSFIDSGAEKILDRLGTQIEVTRWSDIRPNTDAEQLLEGLELMRDNTPDDVIGIGGGSVMDMAKLLSAFPHDTSQPELEERVAANTPVPERSTRLTLVPTTSGSGSEATHFAVVYIGTEKYSVAGPALRTDMVALQPSLTLSGNRHQRATSGMDALCQAIESRWAANATDASRRFAEEAMSLIRPNIVPFCDGDDSRAAAMQHGSHLAGRAIDVSKTTAAHALSYGITKSYGIDHGSAVALTLGHFIDAHTEPNVPLQGGIDRRQHDEALRCIQACLGSTATDRPSVLFAALLDELSLPATLRTVGVEDPTELDALATSVNVERLGNNPVPFSRDALVEVLRSAQG